MVNIGFNFDLFNNYYYFYERLIVLLFSLVPTLLLVWFVLYTDRKSKEPVRNIVLCLLSGILTVALAGYFENLIAPVFSNNIVLTYVWAGIEELSKMAIFFLLVFDNKHYDDIYDGLVYMALIALSFAGLENVMYAFSESTVSSSISLSLMRDMTTIPLHVICGIIIGYFISLGNFSKNKKKRYINFLYAVLFGILIHGTFNALMSLFGGFAIDYNNMIEVLLLQFLPLLAIMIGLFFLAFTFVKRALKIDKAYVNNNPYEKKYDYLMNYDEYIQSYDHKRRVSINQKISFVSKEKEKGDK